MKTSSTKIIPHLWYDQEAREAAEFYVAAFGNGSQITNITTLPDTPSGDVDIVSFTLAGQPFMAISGGPLFKFNPAISFIVNFDPSRDPQARANLDALWTKLSAEGTILMPLDRYPFSDHFGWIADRYGLSWQLMLSNPAGEERPFITPHLLFVGEVCGKAEEAIYFYLSVFKNTRLGNVFRYDEGQPETANLIMFADFMLEGEWFSAADSAHPHEFAFNEAVSFMVYCRDQDEIDAYWEKLSAEPAAEQCGWLKDRYGLSWQIVPAEMDKMLLNGTPEQIARLTQALMPMKKLILTELRKAFYG
ncbi:MAG: VOC family protein [Thermanaerothrix sp.]|jgi:predicted 3-demethylubiquinone-9 3-methyltransferase (glyoxalase superfamily)|uniref:VOC family protein n=1 Tax=Thermanaerothrix solaris TaxID=3058434 RepID=A0ABU3NRR9_9CHLR|nr:VOC family protein [Thermanaerothrix sp. 4228-RoL]MDT8898772.1 VOC family protein [Thermanaerothrix sp. 4228-RoL]